MFPVFLSHETIIDVYIHIYSKNDLKTAEEYLYFFRKCYKND